MAITLSKNQSISLEKTAGSPLTKVHMGVGWDPVKKGGFLGKFFASDSIDLDASCLVLDASKAKIDVVWFRQLTSRDGAIQHSGDNLTGDGDGDDEVITVDLTRLPSAAQYLVFTVNSFRGQTFNEVENAYCRIVNASSEQELARFNLSEKGRHTGVVMAYMTRNGSGWHLTASGSVGSGRTADDLVSDAQRVITV